MANVKITDLNQDTNPASTDVLPFVSISSDETKKVTIADLLENAGDGSAATPGFSFDSDKDTGIYRPGADQLAISTGGTERARITSDGYVRLASGSGGIQFSGDTAADNALDDYEEGDWTPAITADTGSFTALSVEIVKATYTKVGRIVTVQCFIRTDEYDETGASGNLIITGLPFASQSGTARSIGSPLLMEYNSEASFTGTFSAFQPGSSTTYLRFARVDEGTNASGANYLQVDQLETTSTDNRNWMEFSLTYQAT